MRRALRILPVAVAALAAGLIGLFVLLLLFLRMDAGRSFVEGRLVAALAGTAEVSGLSGTLPGEIRLERLVLEDEQGPYLMAQGLALDWRPLALLGGRLHVEHLGAASVSLLRLPEGGAEEAQAGGGIPRPFFGIFVEELSFPEIALAKPVLGEPAVLRAEGAAMAPEGEAIDARLLVERIDGTAGRAEAELTYDPRRDEARLAVTVSEPSAGLVARALDVPGLPPTRLSIHGEGPLADWRGALSFAMGGQAGAEVDFAITRAGGGHRLTATGELDLAGLAPESVAAFLEHGVDLSLDALLTEEGSVRVDRLALTGGSAELSLAGTLAPDGETVEAALDAYLVAGPALAALLPGVEVAGLSLRAEAKGPLAAPGIALSAQTPALVAGGIRLTELDARLTAALAEDGGEVPLGPFRLEATAATLASGSAGLDSAVRGPVRLVVAGAPDEEPGRIAFQTLSLTTPALSLTGDGFFNLRTEAAKLDLALAAPDLAALDPLLGLGLTGRAEIGLQIVGPAAGGAMEADLSAFFAELGGDSPLAAALGERARLVAHVTLAESGAVRVEGLELSSPHLSLAGEASLPADFETIAAKLKAEVPQLAALEAATGAAMTGAASLEATVSGPLVNPDAVATLTGRGVSVSGLALGSLSAKVEARGLGEDPTGRIATTTGSPAGPLTLSTRFALADDSLALTDLSVGRGAARLAGRLTIPFSGEPMTGSLSGDGQALAALAALGGVELSAGGRVTAALAGAGGRQTASVEAELSDVEGPGFSAGSLAADLRVADLSALDISGRVTAGGVSAGGIGVERLRLDLDGTPSEVGFSLALEGEEPAPLDLEAAGSVALGDRATVLSLARLQGSLAGTPLSLLAPARVVLHGDGGITVDGLRLGVGDGSLSLTASLAGGEAGLDLRASGLPLALARIADPDLRPEGRLDAELRLSGPPGAPEGSLSLRVAEARFDAAGFQPAVSVALDGTVQGGRLSLRGTAAGGEMKPASLVASLPLALSLRPFAVSVDETAPASASIDWSGDARSLWALVPIDGHRLSGESEIVLDMSGSLAEPDLAGRVRMTNGRYENLEWGTLFTNIDLALDGADRRLVISRLEANDGGSGRLAGSGEIGFDRARGAPVSLRLELRNATLVRRDDVQAAADADLRLDGDMDGLALSGQVETTTVEVDVSLALPPGVTTLDVVEIRGGEQVAGPQEREGGAGEAQPPTPIALDLSVVLPNRVYVRGRGLESEWQGRFRVTGTVSDPVVAGQVRVVRGQLDFLGRNFRLAEGEIGIAGGGELDPTLNIAATTSAPQVDVTVRVTGRASHPEFALSSSPDLPQDEILSRLLFGRSRASLGPVQALQLAEAAASLAGGGGGEGIMGRLRRLAGVDTLSVGTGAAGDTTVQAGKYLSDEVYVGVERGAAAGTGAATVEVEITPNISVESDLGETGDTNVGVKFKWDY